MDPPIEGRQSLTIANQSDGIQLHVPDQQLENQGQALLNLLQRNQNQQYKQSQQVYPPGMPPRVSYPPHVAASINQLPAPPGFAFPPVNQINFQTTPIQQHQPHPPSQQQHTMHSRQNNGLPLPLDTLTTSSYSLFGNNQATPHFIIPPPPPASSSPRQQHFHTQQQHTAQYISPGSHAAPHHHQLSAPPHPHPPPPPPPPNHLQQASSTVAESTATLQHQFNTVTLTQQTTVKKTSTLLSPASPSTTRAPFNWQNMADSKTPKTYTTPGSRGKPFTASTPGREGRYVDIMDRRHDGRKPCCDMSAINARLLLLAESLMPSSEEKNAWKHSFDSVAQELKSRWPDANIVLFGSASNGLSIRNNNDIDVSIEVEEPPSMAVPVAVLPDDASDHDSDDADTTPAWGTSFKSRIIEEASELLEEAGMRDLLSLPRARVPVVKFTVPFTGTKVDVTVNNTLACINTKLLADYCAIDCRLAQLVAIVKHWAKQRAVNDPYLGTLSSYCYVLMCIYHLQTRNPPVLPVLQELPPTFQKQVGEWSTAFFADVDVLKGFGNENKESLAELVWTFFEYWAWKHDYAHGVISIRKGCMLTKEEKDWTKRVGKDRHLMCVEDPFELSHDLGRTVDKQTREVMRKEFYRAATLLRDSQEDPLDQLFLPFQARKKNVTSGYRRNQ